MDRQERQVRTQLMRFTGHRDRIELALPARMLWQCTYSISKARDVTPPELAFCRATEPYLKKAMLEPVNHLSALQFAQATQLINDTSNWVLKPFERRPVPTVFMIVLRLLEHLIDTEYLVLYAGTAFDQATEIILAELDQVKDLASIDKSATKASTKLLTRLQSLGLYEGAVHETLDQKSA